MTPKNLTEKTMGKFEISEKVKMKIPDSGSKMVKWTGKI